uniref:Putative endonuclease n=1 Tax=viral metagenome TaxID=1070528 RepID=A0A6M3L5W5_9ZZZZ
MYKVYILHFDKPYWKRQIHYAGYSKDISRRIKEHRNGNGSMLVDYALRHGCDFVVGYTHDYDTKQEAMRAEWRLKKECHHERHCTICKAKLPLRS